MSFSARDRSHDNNAGHSSSHDLLEPSDSHDVFRERSTEPEDDSLIEHVLDFLDKYPACFVSRVPLSSCITIC